jgi:hypothetical protein
MEKIVSIIEPAADAVQNLAATEDLTPVSEDEDSASVSTTTQTNDSSAAEEEWDSDEEEEEDDGTCEPINRRIVFFKRYHDSLAIVTFLYVLTEEWEERLQILNDARMLKQVAGFFLHPERPVQTSATACARCFFERPSTEQVEDAEEHEAIFDDLRALKQLAKDYLHPEAPVEVDASAFGRNYFTRPSAVPEMDNEDAEEKARILAESKALKQRAVDFMHPELPVVTSDPAACGRNFFSRASAQEYNAEDEQERLSIMEDLKAMKQLAVDFMHPELPVVTSDPTACGRNYFSRASADEQEDAGVEEERVRALEDVAMLKQLAVDYLHPELPVVTSDPAACGRNYFARASAPEYNAEDEQERLSIMEDLKAMKQLAIDFMHPELPVVTSDPTACGRNYFLRASADEQEDAGVEEERLRALEDMAMLKQLAIDFMHPEISVKTSDPSAIGRNFYSRASAPGHSEMVHSFPPHDDSDYHDYTEDHHHEHLDHFGMDEDVDFLLKRADLHIPSHSPAHIQGKLNISDEEGSNLSRSPSSVMLFADEPIYD